MSWLDEDSDEPGCRVVVNHEEQYAFWPVDRPPPTGWSDTGVRGTPRECAAYVRRVWTDMRPLSLRIAMADADASVGDGDTAG
jgi:MbtH protein